MRSRRPLPTAVLLALLLPAGALSAQTVRGTVRDDEHRRPIPGARLQLVDGAGASVDSARADAQGGYVLRARAPGTHFIAFALEGYASFSSDTLQLAAGGRTFDFRVPLVSSAALRNITEIMHADARLQESLPEICGEPFRPWEAGLLIGVVRERGSERPVGGVRVSAPGTAESDVRATLSTEKGVFVLCNVRVGKAVPVTLQVPGRAPERSDVEIRAGTVAWSDLLVAARRR